MPMPDPATLACTMLWAMTFLAPEGLSPEMNMPVPPVTDPLLLIEIPLWWAPLITTPGSPPVIRPLSLTEISLLLVLAPEIPEIDTPPEPPVMDPLSLME